jgi:hypothetical protein
MGTSVIRIARGKRAGRIGSIGLRTLIPGLVPMWNHTVLYVASSMSFVLTVI